MTTKRQPQPQPSAGRRYLAGAIDVLEQVATHQWREIRSGSESVADTIARGGLVHVFGTGHSHMLAEEMFYRAGGLAAVNPILIESLMLHAGAEESTRLERLSGMAASIFSDVPLKKGDTLIIASNSGGNAVGGEMARLAADAGATIIAIISTRHAKASGPKDDSSRLALVADVVIDNHGTVGDASVSIEGLDRMVAPTSTVAGAAIINAIVAEAVEILVDRGDTVEFFSSSNVDGGDAVNTALVARYNKVVKAL